MNRMIRPMALGLLVAVTTLASAAPYEDYKRQIQRAQEAPLRATTARPESDHHDPAAMQERMRLMQQMQDQMQQAQSVDRMTPEQMRSWIVEHVQTMEKMHQSMMREHHGDQGATGVRRDGVR